MSNPVTDRYDTTRNYQSSTVQFSPEKEIKEARHEVERLREDVEDLKHKVNSSTHSSNLNRNINLSPIRDSSPFVSPSHSKRGGNRTVNLIQSPLAASLDENIAAIKKDLATILDNTRQFVNPLTASSIRSPTSTFLEGNQLASQSFKFPLNQILSPPSHLNRSKPSYYSSFLSPNPAHDQQNENEEKAMNLTPENQPRRLVNKPAEKTQAGAVDNKPINEFGGTLFGNKAFSPRR